MCIEMESELQNEDGFQEGHEMRGGFSRIHLRKQLGAAVQSLQWSYAIFWKFCSEEGVLVWDDGFYNGDIKTRKTVLPMDLTPEELGLQRSQQLRDLYESLLAGENNNQQLRRPCAALSPEDLTDTEWFYMVCMSFVFALDQGVPGRALADGHHIWLYDAHYADSKDFTRSLLAKSAGIQTVVCFPRPDGVLEFGVNESVAEDPSLVQHILTFFLELCKPVCSEQSTFSPSNSDDDEHRQLNRLHNGRVTSKYRKEGDVVDDKRFLKESNQFSCVQSYASKEEADSENAHIGIHVDDINVSSPGYSSNESDSQQNPSETCVRDQTGGSHVQTWQNAEEEMSDGIHGSINSSECISHSIVDSKNLLCPSKDTALDQLMQEVKKSAETNAHSGHVNANGDSHYLRTLAAILSCSRSSEVKKNSYSLRSKSGLSTHNNESSFLRWRKCLCGKQSVGTPQKLLKTVLFGVPKMLKEHSLKKADGIGASRTEHDHGDNHGLSEQRRVEKINESFMALSKFVPSNTKFDKASLLGYTVEYLEKLERRVEELEAPKDLVESEARGIKRGKVSDERPSDVNYVNDRTVVPKKTCTRETSSSGNTPKSELQWVFCKDSKTNVMVTITGNEAVIEIQCPWREFLLLEIVKAMGDVQLDVQSVESSVLESMLKLSLRAKFEKTMAAATREIKHALQRIVGNC